MELISNNEVNDIYQCSRCKNIETVPKGCDTPVCACSKIKPQGLNDKEIEFCLYLLSKANNEQGKRLFAESQCFN